MIHARSGVPYEIMGLMRGKVVDKSLLILDSFALPVQGTETRVNAGDQATEFMVQFLEGSKQASSSFLQRFEFLACPPRLE